MQAMVDRADARSLKYLTQEKLRLMLTNDICLAWVHPIDAINKLENDENKSGKLMLHANVKTLIKALDAMDEDKTTDFFNEVPADKVPLLSRLLGMDWKYAIEFMKTHLKLDVNLPNTHGPLVLTVVGSPSSVGRMQNSTSFFTEAERLQIATAFVSHPKFDPKTLDDLRQTAAQAEHFYCAQSTVEMMNTIGQTMFTRLPENTIVRFILSEVSAARTIKLSPKTWTINISEKSVEQNHDDGSEPATITISMPEERLANWCKREPDYNTVKGDQIKPNVREAIAKAYEQEKKTREDQYSTFMALLETTRMVDFGQVRYDKLVEFREKNAHRMPPRATITTGVANLIETKVVEFREKKPTVSGENDVKIGRNGAKGPPTNNFGPE